jgi:hypothetical protein
MELSKIVGSTFVSHLTDATKFPLLVIGKERWSYQQVATLLNVIQPKACRILTSIAKQLGVKDVKDLYKQTSPYSLAGLHGCGVTTLYVALQVFEVTGLDTEAWYQRGQKDAIVTFTSLKVREQKAEARTRDAQVKRRRLRSKAQLPKDGTALLTN